MNNERARRGFVLLAVLWVMVGVGAVGLGLALAARRESGAAHNRRAMVIAQWAAEDCLNRAEATIDDALHHAAGDASDSTVWATLDLLSSTQAARSEIIEDTTCNATLRAAGTTIDVNTADDTVLTRLFIASGLPEGQADSVSDAILDWRDADQVARPNGAEAAWYVAHNRYPPRDGPFTDIRELRRVRGLEAFSGLDTLLGVDSDRVVLDRAPLPVIATLPGITNEALGRLAELRARGAHLTSVLSFSSGLSPDARATLLGSYQDLNRLTTNEPDAWMLIARGWSGVPRVTAAIELRLVRAGSRAAIVRRRAWVQ